MIVHSSTFFSSQPINYFNDRFSEEDEIILLRLLRLPVHRTMFTAVKYVADAS